MIDSVACKSTYIYDKPQKNIFCGSDKYLRLGKHTISERMFPVLEDDGYYLLVKEGSGVFTLNGVSFDVSPGCVCWIQCAYVLTIQPNLGETFVLWSYASDYQLFRYFSFDDDANMHKELIQYSAPILRPGSDETKQIQKIFDELEYFDEKSGCGVSMIKASLVEQIAICFYCEAQKADSDDTKSEWPLAWRACMYLQANSMRQMSAAKVSRKLGTSVPTLNRELRIVTGLDFTQYLNRLRCIGAASYLLHENMRLDYIGYRSGFKSEIVFYRYFRKVMGLTPHEYRSRMLYDRDDSYRGLMIDGLVLEIVNYLYHNFAEEITIGSIGKALFITDNIIRNRLKDSLGVGFKEILNLFRIRYSEALLSSTNLTVSDIAAMVGFNSGRTYGRIFKSINGISAVDYRKHCLMKNEWRRYM